MRIAVDMDGVLFDPNVVNSVLSSLNCHVEPKTWNLEELCPNARELIFAKFCDAELMNNPERIIAGAQEAVRLLKQDGHTLFVATARSNTIMQRTESFIGQYFPEIDAVFSSHGIAKSKMLKDLDCSLLIDDAPVNILDVFANGFPSVLISNEKTYYNHNFAQSIDTGFYGKVVQAKSLIDFAKNRSLLCF